MAGWSTGSHELGSINPNAAVAPKATTRPGMRKRFISILGLSISCIQHAELRLTCAYPVHAAFHLGAGRIQCNPRSLEAYVQEGIFDVGAACRDGDGAGNAGWIEAGTEDARGSRES